MFFGSAKSLRKSPGFKNAAQVVFTNGCFDILHAGHVQYLQEARSLGDFLVIGLNSDSSVRRLKGAQRPIQQELDRAQVLGALACVDGVVLFQEDTPLKLIQEVQPHILVKGGDWAVDQIVGAKEVLAAGGKVHSLPFKAGRSTTSIVEKIIALQSS